ncbi:MAG: hypothetical protein QXJ17_05380 [Nitrososphaeria archaeon]
MVEIFEKCLIIGISFILASTLYPLQYSLSFNVGQKLVNEQYALLADEIDSRIKEAYLTNQEATLYTLLPSQLSLIWDGENLKIKMGDGYIYVGNYDYDILIKDKRKQSNRTVIEISRYMDEIILVMRDA